jgi:hypothetical protein
MDKNFLKIFFCLTALLIISMPAFSVAASGISDAQSDLGKVAGSVGLTQPDLKSWIGNTLNYLFGFLGIIAIILIIYAGFTWMTAGGNEQQITKGKNIMLWAILGLFIIFAAYGITYTIITQLTKAT